MLLALSGCSPEGSVDAGNAESACTTAQSAVMAIEEDASKFIFVDPSSGPSPLEVGRYGLSYNLAKVNPDFKGKYTTETELFVDFLRVFGYCLSEVGFKWVSYGR